MNHRTIEPRRVGQLKDHPHNVRTHPRKQLNTLANSIRALGFTNPILIDEKNVVLAGHGRLAAARLIGLREVPCIVLAGLGEAQKRALLLADNKIADGAGYDRTRLAVELAELSPLLAEAGLDIELTGFEPAEIDALAADFLDPEQDPADDIPPLPDDAVTTRGDCWLLGKSRLLCGDACSKTDFHRLMGSQRAVMIMTDPPFNLRVQDIQGRGRIKHRNFVAAAGEMSKKQFTEFLQSSLSLAAAHSLPGSIHFVFMDWRHVAEILAAGEQVYSELKNINVWVKTNAGQGSFYRSQHELVFVFKSGNGEHVNNFGLGKHGRHRSNVWHYAGANTFKAGRMDELAMHPTVKPVALVADAIRDCSRRGDLILDPFMGSGTTILAAERTGRNAFGLELDPRYVDVAVRRWQAYAKRDAILAGTRKTFDEIAASKRAKGGRL